MISFYVFWGFMLLGLLNNPFVMLLYAMEQINILIFGGSARASDMRILIWFIVNTIGVGSCIYVYSQN